MAAWLEQASQGRDAHAEVPQDEVTVATLPLLTRLLAGLRGRGPQGLTRTLGVISLLAWLLTV